MNVLALFHERYSTALLADAAYRAGVPLAVPPAGLAPLAGHHKLAGPVVTVQANNDLLAILGALHHARPGDVVVIANRTREVALLGDLIATEAQRKRLAGFVVDGLVRDTTTLLDLGVPVVCRGAVPVGPLKLPAELKGVGERDVTLALSGARVSPGDWAFADADGVIFLASADLPAVYEQAAQSWEREEALAAEVRAGAALGDLLGIDDFLAARESDPGADFNAHLAARGRAI
jgi:4-hydroxy-4-methyl-2-oxoglutarate aldolase